MENKMSAWDQLNPKNLKDTGAPYDLTQMTSTPSMAPHQPIPDEEPVPEEE
jgi:hypothetical protein